MKKNDKLNLILQKLRLLLPLLNKKYQVKSLGVFGSYVHGTQKRNSDLDILIEFEEKPGLLKFIEIENYLSDELGLKVDLVMQSALKRHIGKRILSEVVGI